MTSELNETEKANLLGVVDGCQRESYDRAFYEAMYRTPLMDPTDVDDDVRRAILRFIQNGRGPTAHPETGGLVMMGFIHGYMVGRKLRRDIRKDAGDNPRTIKQAVDNARKQARGKQ